MKKNTLKIPPFIGISFLATVLMTILLVLTFQLLFLNRIYPGIYINNTPISRLTPQEARERILQVLTDRSSSSLKLSLNEKVLQIDLSTLPADPKIISLIDQKIEEAFSLGRRKLYFRKIYIQFTPELNQQIKSQISDIENIIYSPPVSAQLRIDGEVINVTPSQQGLNLNRQQFESKLVMHLQQGTTGPIEIPTKTLHPPLSYESAITMKEVLDRIKVSPIQMIYSGQSYYLDFSAILGILDLQNTKSTLISGNINNTTLAVSKITIGDEEIFDTKLTLNQEKLKSFIKEQVASKIDREVKEPLFNFDGKKVVEFEPPEEGLTLDVEETAVFINEAVLAKTSRIDLPVEVTKPKNKLTNEMGIKELIGKGISNFSGSIANRIYNINLATSKINGILIPPNDEFSFVKTVGDISAATGFKQAYVIKSGRTVLDDGGGVCQVSTTVFRAALNSGLPITERVAHAYRVSYYEQGFPPGLDATIFYPSVDLKFKNDTSSHILIQAHTEGNSLVVELYGTSDKRNVELSKPVILNQTPPLPEIRQDDPTMPKGQVKQVDWPASGANVVFTRKVTRGNDVLINETFRSNYRSWQAVYLVGTKEL